MELSDLEIQSVDRFIYVDYPTCSRRMYFWGVAHRRPGPTPVGNTLATDTGATSSAR